MRKLTKKQAKLYQIENDEDTVIYNLNESKMLADNDHIFGFQAYLDIDAIEENIILTGKIDYSLCICRGKNKKILFTDIIFTGNGRITFLDCGSTIEFGNINAECSNLSEQFNLEAYEVKVRKNQEKSDYYAKIRLRKKHDIYKHFPEELCKDKKYYLMDETVSFNPNRFFENSHICKIISTLVKIKEKAESDIETEADIIKAKTYKLLSNRPIGELTKND